MTLLSTCQNAATQLGLRQPAAVVGSTDLNAQILLRLANQEGDELSRWHDWQALIVDHTFTSVAAEIQSAAIAADYDRLPHNVEVWNRSNNIRFTGPAPQRYWQQLKSSGISSGINGYWRLSGGSLRILPVQTAGLTFAFEYLTKNWCESGAGTGQSEFMADTDVALIPERLITLGIVWRYRMSRGFGQYAEDMATYEREKDQAAARDRGTGRIRSGGNAHSTGVEPFWSGTIEN